MLAMLALVALTGLTGQGRADTDPAADLKCQVKAAFLYNFTKFAEWAPEVDRGDSFVIGVVGSGAMERALASCLQGKARDGRPYVVRHIASARDFDGCQVVFIDAAEVRRTQDLLASLRGLSILTVGEAEGFVVQGGVIGLVTHDGKLRFEINAEAADQARIRLSSQLLALATTVHDSRP
jgi:hypothetical protein